MTEYIERKAAIQSVKHAWAKGLEPSQYIEIIPAADVAPARHGSIIETIEDGRMKRVASCCGADFTKITCWMTLNYCPNCGAKIFKEENTMSESREHKRRYNQRLEYIAQFTKWLEKEPPIILFWKWRKWKNERPVWKDV